MEENINIFDYIQSHPECKIATKRCLPIAGGICLVAGILLLVLTFKCSMADALKMTALTIGAVLAITGIFMLVVGKDRKQHYYTPTCATMKSVKRYISASDAATCRSTLNSNSIAGLSKVEKVPSSNVQLHILISNDDACALVQQLEYIPHEFQPTTEVVVVTGADVNEVRQFLNNK